MSIPVIYGIMATTLVAAIIGVAFDAGYINNHTFNAYHDYAANAQQPTTTSDSTQVINHSMGVTEIAGTPERIVVLEWVYAEDLLALGVQPVGVADIQGMKEWVNLKGLSLSPEVVDVGTRQEPNLEIISSLNPDLIIAPQFRVEQSYESLGAIAPTLVFNPYPTEDTGKGQLEEMQQTFMTIADLLNLHDKGVEVLTRLDEIYAQAEDQVHMAEASDREFTIVQAYTQQNAPYMRIFTNNSMASQIMNNIGLKNAWNVAYELYGYTETSIESLAEVLDANFFYIVQEDDNPFATHWNTPVWHNMEFVKQGRTYSLGGDNWLFGGPISAEQLVDNVVASIAKDAGNSSGVSNQTRTINHTMGTTQITGTPERILAIGPEFVEHLLALGVQPAGIIESATFRLWYPSLAEELSPSIVDLGDYPPNLEAIAQLQPDLILAGASLYGEFYEELSSIAPTVMFQLFPEQNGGPTQLEIMEEVHMTIADIVDRHNQGINNIELMHAKFEEGANALQTAGLAGHKFIYVEAGVWEESPWMNVYSENAELSLILEQLGLENAVGDDTASAGVPSDSFGFISSSLEGLAALDGQHVHMLYTTALGSDVFTNSTYWSQNPVWTNLQFVKEGRVYNLDKVYAFAGPNHAELLVDKVIEALT
jgi:ABC-type Fe3+-hydroxamate transport system substrate-binding protein